MAQYFLRNPWLAPNGQWFEAARVFPVEIPEELVPFLPKTAELSDGASRTKPNPAPMANVRTVGGPSVNSAQIFAQQISKPAPEAPAPEPVPEPVAVEVQAAEDFANARVEAEAAPAEPKGKAKRK